MSNLAYLRWPLTYARMYPHFMLKEIEEQGGVLRRTLAGRLAEDSIDLSVEVPMTDETAASLRRIQLVACGTSHCAALATAGLFDRFTGLDLRVETASEYRYGDAVCDPSTLSVFVSQSGETADTLAAARGARAKGARCLAVTNVAGSSLAREVGAFLELRAGPEIGVAATKTRRESGAGVARLFSSAPRGRRILRCRRPEGWNR